MEILTSDLKGHSLRIVGAGIGPSRDPGPIRIGPHRRQPAGPVVPQPTIKIGVKNVLNVNENEVRVMRRPATREPFTNPNAIPVVAGPRLRSGTPTAVGFLPAGLILPDGFVIPYYDTRTKKGYQRPPQDARINQLASDLRNDRTDLPTAVLLNVRDRRAPDLLSGGMLRTDGIKNDLIFHVVDGQHRVLALAKLMNEDAERWAHFGIPFVCLLGAEEEEEMNQFYIVNSTAKSVKTDLALALLRRRTETDAGVYEALQERGRAWMSDGQHVVERLVNESSIWRGRIRLPSMEKGGTTISSASFVSSMKPLLVSPYFGGLKPEQQLKVLEAFWVGVREVLRPAFDDPEKYVIQKGVAVIVLHSLLPDVLERVRTRGLSTTDPNAYAKMIHDALIKLEGDKGTGDPVSGLEFWLTGQEGAAGSYSSSSGRRVLAAKIRMLLPEVEVE